MEIDVSTNRNRQDDEVWKAAKIAEDRKKVNILIYMVQQPETKLGLETRTSFSKSGRT